MRIGKIILILSVFLLVNLPALAVSAEGEWTAEKSTGDSATAAGQSPSAKSAKRSSPCQQLCYQQYKSGTDFCYSTSIASEDLNICIMDKREMFKNCSKTC